MSFENVLPQLSAFIEAEVAPDGTSPRGVDAPLNWPNRPNLSDKVVFINQWTGLNLLATKSIYSEFNLLITCRLYYSIVGEGLDINQYDLYHYATDFVSAVTQKNRLTVAGADLPGITRAVTFANMQVPAVFPYPVDNTQAVNYNGAVFTLNVSISIQTLC
jgi:hypothetical protein